MTSLIASWPSVGHFNANTDIQLPTSKFSGRDKTMLREPKNWYAVTDWVKLNSGVFQENPHQKIRLAYCLSISERKSSSEHTPVGDE